MKQYYPDPKFKKKLQRTQYKRHPLWHKRKWVRRILLLIGPIVGIMYYCKINKSAIRYEQDLEFFEIMRINIAVCMAIFGSIPFVAYYKILQGACICVTYHREHDTVVITDEDIKYLYHPSHIDDIKVFQQLETRYEDITKIIYNTYHQRIDIYGKRREIWYSDYTKGKFTTNKNVNKPDTRIRLYLYFEGNEEIIKTLQEKSPVKMEIIDHPEE